MGRQLIPVGMGMGIMPGREGRFWDRVVGRVGQRVSHRMVPGILNLALLVRAGV
jgi:hypothetical protein